MRPSVGLIGLFLLLAPTVIAQGVPAPPPPPNDRNRPTTTTADDDAEDGPRQTTTTQGDDDAKPTTTTADLEDFKITDKTTPTTEATTTAAEDTGGIEDFKITDAPTIAGIGIPTMVIPDTSKAPYMQKSNLPDGTVFICVGAALGFFGAAILAWRGLVAWSLHRSVKRAALAQNLADMKAMTAVPGKKRGMYNVVGANSNMSLDRLSAAPPGTSRPTKPFASTTNSSTPPKSNSSLFFSPTAGNRDSVVNRSSTYLPPGYYPTGNAAPASGSPVTHVGGQGAPGNRYSHRGVSPPGSPSLPPSRGGGYDRAPPSRDGLSMYNRNSMATSGAPPGSRGGLYGQDGTELSQSSLNLPGGTGVAGGRAPSAYLEDLFENHGNGPRERF